MNRKVGRRRKETRKHYLLPQILPMRPYLFSLMAELRACHVRQQRLQREMGKQRPKTEDTYEQRRQRYDAGDQYRQCVEQKQELIREFRKLSLHVGSIVRGEMLFPCLVDNREAYFVWFDSEHQPTHYRFRHNPKLHPIPPRWFSLFQSDEDLQSADDWA